MTLGFIGTGTIAAAFIGGLQKRHAQRPILVSPRSETTSRALAEKFANVQRAGTNAEVAAGSDIVFLAMRPTQLEEALAGISFGPRQVVISFVTGLGMEELQGLAPQSRVGRVLPLPAIEHGEGPVICYPALPEIVTLLDGMGDVVVASEEQQLRTLSSVSGFMSSYFELQLSLVAWLEAQGAEPATASLYVRSMLAGLAQTGLRTPDAAMAALPAEHQTKGGLNQRVRQFLIEAGWFDAPRQAFASIANAPRATLK